MASYYCSKFDLTSKPATMHLFLAEGEAEVGFIEQYLKTIQPSFDATTILCFKGLGNVRDKTDTLVKFIEKGPANVDQLRGIGVILGKLLIDGAVSCLKFSSANRARTTIGHWR
jgi:hypothetical protein